MKCVHCGHENELVTVGFRSMCGGCGEYLHSCIQCRLFNRTSERCTSMTTEPVRDRKGHNYCEEFQPGGGGDGDSEKYGGGDFEALFGDR